MKKVSLITIFLCLLLTIISHAEIIKLKSGKSIEGKIVEQAANYIKINFQDVVLTFYSDELESIDGKEWLRESPQVIPQPAEKEVMTKNISDVREDSVLSTDGETADRSHDNPNEERVFLERLSLVLKQDSEDLNKIEKNADNLTKFALEYPNSRFADDAQIIPVFMSFIGAASHQDKKGAEFFIPYVERVTKTFPGGVIEQETVNKLEEILGTNRTGAFLIPNNKMATYMRGFLAFEIKEYGKAIENYSLLKDAQIFDKDKTEDGNLAGEIYGTLISANIKLKRFEDARTIVNEATAKFPNYKWPAKWLNVVNNLSSTQK